jgi:hypothetical protein
MKEEGRTEMTQRKHSQQAEVDGDCDRGSDASKFPHQLACMTCRMGEKEESSREKRKRKEDEDDEIRKKREEGKTKEKNKNATAISVLHHCPQSIVLPCFTLESLHQV